MISDMFKSGYKIYQFDRLGRVHSVYGFDFNNMRYIHTYYTYDDENDYNPKLDEVTHCRDTPESLYNREFVKYNQDLVYHKSIFTDEVISFIHRSVRNV